LSGYGGNWNGRYERLYFLITRLVKDFAGCEAGAEDYVSRPALEKDEGHALT
jgi:hypothetical protein